VFKIQYSSSYSHFGANQQSNLLGRYAVLTAFVLPFTGPSGAHKLSCHHVNIYSASCRGLLFKKRDFFAI